VQLLGGQGKALAAGDGFKGLQGGERRNHDVKSVQLLRCNMNEIELPVSLYRLCSSTTLSNNHATRSTQCNQKRRHACY
jgi:hypothetical protein